MDYLGKGGVLTNTDLDRFVNNIWEKFLYIEKVLDLWVQLMKNGGQKQKCCIYNFVQCIQNQNNPEMLYWVWKYAAMIYRNKYVHYSQQKLKR